ncbi:MAG: GNAT family N-acetyltransferase [Bacillota bacterium]
MKTTNRGYSDVKGDFNLICDFLIKQNEYLRSYSSWSLPRFCDWRHGLYRPRTSVANFWGKSAQLWFDAFDKLAGFVISENGNTGFCIITSPGYRFLFKEILEWTMQNWGNRGAQFGIEVSQKQEHEITVLEQFGFNNDSTFYIRYFDLTAELKERYPLEEGFEIIDMGSTPEYREQRILRANGFGGILDVSEEELNYQLEFYNNTHNSPIYHPDTDLCIKSKTDGIHVACCEALIDAWNCTADVERVCTHSEYRRRGFAQVVIQECLYRLKTMGIKKAYITGFSKEAISLYGTLGAVDELELYEFVKDINV